MCFISVGGKLFIIINFCRFFTSSIHHHIWQKKCLAKYLKRKKLLSPRPSDFSRWKVSILLFDYIIKYRAYKYEMQIYKLKKHVKFSSMIKKCFIWSMIHRLLYIFSMFRAIYEYHASKNLPLLPQTIHWAIFVYLRTN